MGDTPLVRCIERQYAKARLASKRAPSSGCTQKRKNAHRSMANSASENPTRQAELATSRSPYPFSRLVTTMFATIAPAVATQMKITTFHTTAVFVGGLGIAEKIPQPH